MDEESHGLEQNYVPNNPELKYSEKDGYTNDRPAISDVEQAIEVFDNLFDDAEVIIEKAAMIRKKYDGIDPPYNPAKLKQEGKANKSNISTGCLATYCSRIPPRLYGIVNSAKFLTAVDLPKIDLYGIEVLPIENSEDKSRKLKEIYTRKVKEWVKWYPFLVGLANETSAFGHTFAAWTDDIDWRPRLYRLDAAQVPTGTEVLESEIPFFGIKDELQVHELFDKIRDKEIAEEAGWEVDNVIECIKEAAPLYRPDSTERQDQITWEDMCRELIPGYSNRKNVNIIVIGHLFAMEYDGRVSHWIFDRKQKKLLFKKEGRYNTMLDVVVPFVYEFGNGTIHGSQGAGHKLYDLAVGIEKARNSAIDNLRNRGKIQLEVDGGPSALQKAKVIHHDDMTIIAGAKAVGQQVSLPDTTEASINLDNWYKSIAEDKIGAYTPPPRIPGVTTTATQEMISAERENEERQAISEFWLKNFSVLMDSMKRRMFNPMSTDQVSELARKEALAAGISEREIEIWRNTNASGSLLEFTSSEEAKVLQYASSVIGNPRYRQDVLEYDRTASAIGTRYAERWIIPAEDQTEQAEAIRMQTLELDALEKGRPVPVSPRDNHMIHIEILRGQKNEQTGYFDQGAIGNYMQTGNIPAAQLAFNHYMNHVQIAEQTNQLGEGINDERDFQAQFKNVMLQIQKQGEQNAGQQISPNP